MNLRLIGLWMCPLAFVAMLIALVQDKPQLVLIEAALMITGAVLSLHPKKQRAIHMHVTAPERTASEDAAAAMRKYHATHGL